MLNLYAQFKKGKAKEDIKKDAQKCPHLNVVW